MKAAQDRGLYVGVMLFQGLSVAKKSPRAQDNPWPGHPFHRDNNINSIDGDPNADGQGYEVHTLDIPGITALQEAYVRNVIETVGQFDNVLYEISNESHGGSTAWQYHMIALIRELERSRGKQHPVWMSFQYDGNIGAGVNRTLFESKAEAISPQHVSDSMDGTKLKDAVLWLDTHSGPDGAKGLVLVRNGHLIWKGPDAGAYRTVFSCTKVFTSTVLGLLVDDGKCRLDDRAVQFLPRLDDEHPAYARITLRHLASMSGGYRGVVRGVSTEEPWGDPMAYADGSTTGEIPHQRPHAASSAFCRMVCAALKMV